MKYAIERSGYKLTKEQIMYVNNFNTEKEYDEYMEWYEGLEETSKTSAVASLDKKLEKYEYYSSQLRK